MFVVPTQASPLIAVVSHDLLPMTNSNPQVSRPSKNQGIFQTFYMFVTAENLRIILKQSLNFSEYLGYFLNIHC